MAIRLFEPLLPPGLELAPRVRLRLLTIYFLAAVATVVSAMLAGAGAATGHGAATLPRLLLCAAAPLAALASRRRPDRVWPMNALLLAGLLAAGLTAWATDPLDMMPLMWAALIPLISTMVLSRRMGFVYLLATLGLFAAVLGSERGMGPRPFTGAVVGPFEALRASVFLGVVTVLAYLFDQDRDRAMRAADRALREAEAEDRRKSRFLSAMSHELRTPLNGVLGMVELLLGEPLAAHDRETLELVRRSGRALGQAIEDVVRSTSEGHAREAAPVEAARVAGIVDDVVALSLTRATGKGLALTSAVSPEVPAWIQADEVKLRQILHNLVGNAVKFTERGGVHVEVGWAPRGALEVSVVDTGIGIPGEAMDTLFQRFEQVGRDHGTRFGGSGLGLAITQALLESMGSTLHVDSTAGAGTRFSFVLAAERAAAPSGQRRDSEVPAPVTGRRLLVVDDNAVNLRVLQLLLERAGFAVVTAVNGRIALERAQQERFDAILMDCHMPELDGYAATRALRALPAPLGQVPVIAVTAAALPEEVEACFDAGCDDVVLKPVERARLLRALDAAWTRTRARTPRAAPVVAEPVPARATLPAAQGLSAWGRRVVGLVDGLVPAPLRADHEARMRARVTLLSATFVALMSSGVAAVTGSGGQVQGALTPLAVALTAAGVFVATRATRGELGVYRAAFVLITPLALGNVVLAPWLLMSELSTLTLVPLVATLVLGRASGLRWSLIVLVGGVAAVALRALFPPMETAPGQALWQLDTVRFLGFVAVVTTSALFFDLSRAQGREAAEAASERARAAARAKTDFLANMTHELRTPMSGIIGLLELLGTTRLPPEQLEKLNSARESGQRLLRLIDDVLDYARLDRGKLELVTAPSTLGELLGPVEASAAARAADGPARLAWRTLLAPAQRVSVDRTRLGKVMETLIDNAFKFVGSGRVEVECRWSDDDASLLFIVEDDGPGMTPDVQRRVLDPFEQADATIRRTHEGAGLGLALARALVTAMHGTLVLRSAAGAGTRIELRVPLEALGPAPVLPALRERVAASGCRRVLVVDDAPVNRAVAGALVQRLGFEPGFASNGLEALLQLAETPFAAVLMDCQMPVLDGLEAMRRLRALPEHRALPIVAVTASNEGSDLAAARAAGASHVLTKPLLEAALAEALGRFVEPRSAETRP